MIDAENMWPGGGLILTAHGSRNREKSKRCESPHNASILAQAGLLSRTGGKHFSRFQMPSTN